MTQTNITDTTLVSTHTRGSKDFNAAVGLDNNKASGATAGTPGTWTPSGATPPANTSSMSGVKASPATPWTTGQFVQTRTSGAAGRATWTGSAWVGGVAP